MMFSVIVCNYNSSEDEIEYTLASIISQKNIELEIIFSDDGSINSPEKFVKNYFNEQNFTKYKIRIGEKNLGTVKALHDAVRLAEGEYVKPIGVGDALTYEDALKDIYDFMISNNAKIAFSDMMLFSRIDGEIHVNNHFTIPRKIQCWKEKDYDESKENIIVFNDQISGASIFYKRKYFELLVEVMINHVIYMEDLCQYIAILNNERIYYYGKKCVSYEIGNGVSNNHTSENLLRMKKDKESFLNYLFTNYNSNNLLQRRKRLEEIDSKYSNKVLKGIIKEIAEPKWLYFKMIRMKG